jgi:hypothetical protein
MKKVISMVLALGALAIAPSAGAEGNPEYPSACIRDYLMSKGNHISLKEGGHWGCLDRCVILGDLKIKICNNKCKDKAVVEFLFEAEEACAKK